MANVKMTEREILNAVIDGTIDPDILVEYAEKRIGQLDKRNASAAKRAAAKRAAGDELMESVFGFVTDEPQTRGQIAATMVGKGFEVTDAKVGARLNKLVTLGRIQKANSKFVDADGKRHTVVVYATEIAE